MRHSLRIETRSENELMLVASWFHILHKCNSNKYKLIEKDISLAQHAVINRSI